MLMVSFCIVSKVYASRQSLEARSLLDAIHIIDKDVPRTDRELEYFRYPVLTVAVSLGPCAA